MANTLFRGELFFTASELESFHQRLKELWDAASKDDAAVDVPWQLAPLDAAIPRGHYHLLSEAVDMNASLPPKRERSNNIQLKKNASRRTLASDIPGHSTIDDDIDSLFKEIMDEGFDEMEGPFESHKSAFPQQEETVEYDNTSSLFPLLNPDDAVLTSMPTWLQKLHHVVASLCHTKSGSLFAAPIEGAAEGTFETAGEEASPMPPVKSVTLHIVLEKVLQNGYASSTEAFAEIYAMLLTMFKFQAPGTIPWMSTHDACCKLEKLRRDSNLVDSETAHVSFGGKHLPAANPMTLPRQLPASLDFVAEIQPVSSQEKAQFQDALMALPEDCHVELYIAFEHLAAWKILGNGEIELDDEATNSNVFRYVSFLTGTTPQGYDALGTATTP
ncbi:hypothetical protein, conserved [Babesia bigemina]|uniref:Uncharacterized protein n=1 Tax=Babesia bigemina TaxID=5866 RepID=A0A061D5N6_BABBI|nr:hypothetical protein, conserved [Babesia bigemina]CDR94264.1 hypothetical protein, conserved [Babesia bigemina]|eukprot:XP_012766450.1 hypothetical protein, conserved [Babesia bigemina]